MVTARRSEPTLYDFRRPNKFHREHVRALQIACETFSRHATTVCSSTLRVVSQVSHRDIAQMTYDEFLSTLPTSTFLGILELNPLPGKAALQMPLKVMLTAVEHMLGGSGEFPPPNRPLTEIESALAKTLLDRMLHELAYAFEALAPVQPQLVHQEFNPQFAQVASAADNVITLAFDLRIGNQSGVMTLCIPLTTLQPALDAITKQQHREPLQGDDLRVLQDALHDRVSTVPVAVRVRFTPVTVPANDVVNLRPGDVLPLLHRVGEPLDVLVGEKTCFRATPGRRGKRLACVIVDDLEELR